MSSDGLDPAIHAPARLRIMVTLASLRDGDDMSFTRLQYITTHKNGAGVTGRTAVALTVGGRAALDRYSTVLRELLDSASPQ
jgi:hypothetical protein